MDSKTFWHEFKAGHVAVRIKDTSELDVFNAALTEHGLPESSRDSGYVYYPWRVAYGPSVVGWTGEGVLKDTMIAYFTFAEWLDIVDGPYASTTVVCPDLAAVL